MLFVYCAICEEQAACACRVKALYNYSVHVDINMTIYGYRLWGLRLVRVADGDLLVLV